MKKPIFELIKKIDFVLILIASLLGIAVFSFVLVTIIGEMGIFRDRHSTRQIAVIDKENNVEVKEHIEFYHKIKDLYVFAVRNSGIKSDELYGVKAKRTSCFSDDSDNSGITNFIFIKQGEKTERTLFPSNVFIYKHSFQLFYEDEPSRDRNSLECNVYAVIKEDTNNDKVLNDKDSIALYVSDYDGGNLKEISSAAVTFQLTDKNQFLFSEYDGTNLLYFVYDRKEDRKHMIKSVTQEAPKKSIRLYY